MKRRDFVRAIALATGTLYIKGYDEALAAIAQPPKIPSKLLREFNPVDRGFDDVAPRQFFGDELTRAHAMLRDGTMPPVAPPSEQANVVVIGGGIAGLFSAYLLRRQKPILLEQASRFGGNSKAQSWLGNDFALGAAYYCYAEEDDPTQLLYNELGLDKLYKVKEEEDPVLHGGRVYRDFWEGVTAPGEEAQFKKLGAYFKSVYNEENDQRYPEIPFDADEDAEMAAYVAGLDRKSLRQLAEEVAGGSLHPHIETALQHYCWSSLGASLDEVSAAGGLNFYAAEFGPLYVTPGGNAGAAEQILRKIGESVSPKNLRAGSMVYSVERRSDGVHVSYVGADGPKTIKAKAVVMACPKFVVKKVLRDIEPERVEAIERLNYRSYLVANVLLRGKPKEDFYDLYMLQDGRVDSSDLRKAAMEHGFQDTINAAYAHPDPADPEHAVMTLYRGIPYDGAREEIEPDDSYESWRAAFAKQVEAQVLPVLGFDSRNIVDLRVARWGHALPISAVGLIADGVVQQLRAPFKDRVFFVEQDNWALPAFETCLGEAMNWQAAVEAAIEQG